jgi:lipoate---protein ligase
VSASRPTSPSRPAEAWRRLGPDALAPAEAVARPLRLLEELAPGAAPVLSWSTVRAPALVLGRSGRVPAVDRAACAAAGVEVLARRSGGGPVLWDAGLLALDVVLPRGHLLAEDDVVQAYRWVGEALAGALRALGVGDVAVVAPAAARAARAGAGPAAAVCFGGLSPYEVTAGGRKVVGLSQARRAAGTLLQAGIALRLDAEGLAGLLAMDPAARSGFTRDLGARAGGLPPLAPADVVAAAEEELSRRAGARLTPAPPPPSRPA